MTVAEVSVGATYNAKIGDAVVPVTLTESCEWGGWWGTNDSTGERIRVTTARLIGPTDSSTNPTVQEDNNMATATRTAASTAAKNERAARRRKSNTTTTATPTEESTAMPTVKITAPATSKPAAKRAAKPKAAARVTAPINNGDTVTISKADLDAIIAKSVAEALGTVAAEPTTKPAAKRATAKPVVVKLKANNATTNKIQFVYVGKDENPLVTAVYVNLPLIERFAADGSPVELPLSHYVPRPKQKPMPKSKIRYSGDTETVTDLYVNRAVIEAMGYSETNVPVVTVKVISDDEISLTFPKA